jgi:DNA (cytosine-5)-methyltransferase 1
LNVGSLFSGIGGFDLGFERCGMRVVWQVERDPFCRAILSRHFPGAERFEDVRRVGAVDLPPVDLICGGFPCQDLSVAGKGGGLDAARSGLWSEFARVIRELRPGYVVVENVPALLTGKGKRWDRAPIGRVLRDLAEMGYDAEWSVLSAREFGAPHLRKRVWIVAYPSRDAEARAASEPGPEWERVGARRAEGRAPEMADADRERRKERKYDDPERKALSGDAFRGGSLDGFRGWSTNPWRTEPGVGRVADGVPDRVDRLAGLGNALVPQIAEWIGRRIVSYEEERHLT